MRARLPTLWRAGLWALALALPATAAEPDSVPPRLAHQAAQLLARRCLECHNPSDLEGNLDLTRRATALAGGDSGPALVPGDPATSLLLARVAAGEMPPTGPLSAAEQTLVRDWIEAGADWTEEPLDRFRYSSDHRAGYDWWSLAPLARPEPPAVNDANWPLNPVDRFVLARLDQAGLAPSPEAAPAVLVRRLYFDLTGLPPTPEEVASFTANPSSAAYEALVDQLLASPRYGERWARHWLDVARFAETNGFEYDEPRRHAWPYRDWVIAAWNDDLPYDDFCRWQLAGDVLAPDNPAAVTATGFLVAGPYDTPGQQQQSAAMRAVVRQDELEELVGTVAQTFLGLTLNCARCHDHKFDPLSQLDYYRLAAALSGTRHGERDLTTQAERAHAEEAQRQARAEVERLNVELTALEAPVRRRLGAAKTGAGPRPLVCWQLDDLGDEAGDLPLTLAGSAVVRDGAIVLDGQGSYAVSPPLPFTLTAKTLQAWVRLDDLEQRGGGVLSVQALDGSAFDAIVFGERELRRWQAGSEFFSRTESFAGPAEEIAATRPVRITITYAADGTIAAYRDGVPYGRAYTTSDPRVFPVGQSQVLLGLRHATPGGNRLLRGAVLRAEVFDRALSAEEVAAAGDEVSTAEIVAQLDAEQVARHAALTEQLAAARRRAEPPPARLAYACKPQEPEPTRVLRRGDPRLAGDEVIPGGIAAVASGSDLGLAATAPEAERRRALAVWITRPDNPLFHRVIVNRIWHYHFGVGLVDTPNDFGFSGGRPSHPELLDWLAAELAAGGYRLKHLHRLLVTSRTYRQASAARAECLPVDRANRLLWRRTPQRLEAEAIRDALLAAGGRLTHSGGGPGFRDFEELNRAGTWSYRQADLAGDELQRRTIFRMVTRGGRGGLLDTFDCPDPSTTTPRRAVTTTPLQALALFNNGFALRMSAAFAERVEGEAGDDPAAQVERAFWLAYGRPPSPTELSPAVELISRHGLPALARALFNSNEFLYVD